MSKYFFLVVVQDLASQDMTPTVRLVAGPGTGKSFVIEGRVLHLLQSNVNPASIFAVSFTRAAANDLRDRIVAHCSANNQPNVTAVRVSTLHSLALYILRQTGNLNVYPTNPQILDDWELKYIFDAELSSLQGASPTRCEEIRRDHEAFWSTGAWGGHPVPIAIPITQQERGAFQAHFTTRTQLYCCVLPGEVIRTCVNLIQNGHINPVEVLGITHLIVDEVQDLNHCDFEFIEQLIAQGVNVFISGDDDQSIYSFRYAFPFGIQNFITQHPATGNHVLQDCFRCTPAILGAAVAVINTFPGPNRIPKQLASVYVNSNPPTNGFIRGNIFNTHVLEATYLARSCQSLIAAGASPKDILVLISNKRVQLTSITNAFDQLNLDYDANIRDDLRDSDHGRFLIAALRILSNTDDYIAHRILLSTPRGIGLGTCTSIAGKIVANNLNFRQLFYQQLPNNIFTQRETNALNKVRNNIAASQAWTLNDQVGHRTQDVENLINQNFTQAEANEMTVFLSGLPTGMILQELMEFVQTDSQEIKDTIIATVVARAGNQQPAALQTKIRIMSLHSSKGLSAKVVFLPGLEEGIFPNAAVQQIPGLVLEGARLMYVGITRAKAACILSYARRRSVFGQSQNMTCSRYAVATGVQFQNQANQGLSPAEIQQIQNEINNL